MKRIKKHRIKSEKPETSTSYTRAKEDYDLAYYIHDRVELMHQVFSVLKHKDIKAMAPECVRHISIDDLQELCTEELLGISSKRLCAIMDGAEPPSDTESSSSQSPERMETISLDSISSDEEILSQSSSKKSKKHKHRHAAKTKKKKTKDKPEEKDTEQSRASRAGLTVLELLELQARARAIRAQLQQEQAAKKQSSSVAESSDADGDVEIKEEPAEVVEISSDEDKPKVEPGTENNAPKEAEKPNEGQSVTKRINNLIITVPQTKQTRKIKLNRNKATVTVASTENNAETNVATSSKTTTSAKEVAQIASTSKETVVTAKAPKETPKAAPKDDKPKEKQKKKAKKKDKRKSESKDGSDHDEITLQLSDTEKMDLLEDLDRKNFDKLSSSSSEDSESSSSDSDDESQGDVNKKAGDKDIEKETTEKSDASQTTTVEVTKYKNVSDSEIIQDKCQSSDVPEANVSEISHEEAEKQEDCNKSNNSERKVVKSVVVDMSEKVVKSVVIDITKKAQDSIDENKSDDMEKDDTTKDSCSDNRKSQNSNVAENINSEETTKDSEVDKVNMDKESESALDVSSVEDIPVMVSEQSDNSNGTSNSNETSNSKDIDENLNVKDSNTTDTNSNIQEANTDTASTSANEESQKDEAEKETSSQEDEKGMSEGELSDRASSEIEAFEVQPEVVCISDEETDKKSHKKKKKKEKKSKKAKKAKKSKSDFREGGDQNFFKETGESETDIKVVEIEDEKETDVVVNLGDNDNSVDDYDDVYEILELSDDSSCYEVEGTVLSKEPTAEEIEALSAKIDQIERVDVVTEEEIREHERKEMEKNGELTEADLENLSWKDRYLDSKKVKKVLSTSSIFNALRKKNRELKKKLEESKKKEEVKEIVAEVPIEENKDVEEGSIEHFKTLQGSTKYVDPVKEKPESAEANPDSTNNETETTIAEVKEETQVTREMKKDAKQLLKMYKRLLKYNDIKKQKDPNKKKKKKTKKKGKDSGVASA